MDEHFEVTECGRYRLRNGGEVEVKDTDWPGKYPVRGHHVDKEGCLSWTRDGFYVSSNEYSHVDIVSRVSETLYWWCKYELPPYFLYCISPDRPAPDFMEITKAEYEYLDNPPDNAVLKRPENGEWWYRLHGVWGLFGAEPARPLETYLGGYRWVHKPEPEPGYVDLEVYESRMTGHFWYNFPYGHVRSLTSAPSFAAFLGYVWDDSTGVVVNNQPLMFRDECGALWSAEMPGRVAERPRAVRWKAGG